MSRSRLLLLALAGALALPGCTQQVVVPFVAPAAPPAILDGDATLAIEGSHGWAVARFVVPKTAWDSTGTGRALELSSEGTTDARAQAVALFEVKDERLSLVYATDVASGWRFTRVAEPADVDFVLLIALAEGTQDANISLRVGDRASGAATLPSLIVARGEELRISTYREESGSASSHGAQVNDTRTSLHDALRLPGNLSVRVEHELGPEAFHVARFRWDGVHGGSLVARSVLDGEAREHRGAYVQPLSPQIHGFALGRAAHAVLALEVEALSPAALPNVAMVALTVPWQPASAGLATPHEFSVGGLLCQLPERAHECVAAAPGENRSS